VKDDRVYLQHITSAGREAFLADKMRQDATRRKLQVIGEASDIMTSPGRAPNEAEALIEWMRQNEDAWRT
jgi:uncharacterized protein with HEPN domain